MEIFHVGVLNDSGPPASEDACGVEVLVSALSRMDATAELRRRGFTSFRSRDLKLLAEARMDPDGGSTPSVLPGEVWARPVYVDGAWEKR